ncbi:hypothetical protein [Nocardioides ferulae]|uniref:hypothetical protein n=1 Tax=Nocardioides ferulae TaxID=2340821 RepID=UPI000EB4AA61|nr:hypothetical protein [Nocardioides ferulae]
MNSSGIKRGLAYTAVSALAVTGLPFLATSASANSIAEQAGAADEVVLVTPEAVASIKNDGVNATVRLLATGGPDVAQVHFEYSTDGGTTWANIATVARENGAFSTEWTPAAALYNTTVDVRATEIDNIGVEGNEDENSVLVSPSADSIDIANAGGSAVGAFQQPYTGVAEDLLAAVSGTTSDLGADPTVRVSTDGATWTAEDYAETVTAGDTSRDWSAPVELTGYTWDATAPIVDQAVIQAEVTGEGEDAEAVSLYKQTITTVTATAKAATVQTNEDTTVTVKVTDQNGAPIVGAQVFEDDNQDNIGDAAAAYTNSRGEVTFSGVGGSPTGETHYYFVNTTNTATYENGTDFKRSVTVTEYAPGAASITPSSADGAAFDFDENDGDDISVLVKDQNGAPLAGQIVRYAWKVTPFTATAGYPKTLPEASATTGPDGVADIPFTADLAGTYELITYINRDGTPGKGDGDLAGAALSVKAGQADVVWEDGTVAQAQSNTTATFEGTLELADGTPLPGRNLSIAWTPTGDAVVAAQAAQPAGTTRTGNTGATTKTAADGSFGVALTDPPVVAPAVPANELGGFLTAATANTPDIGNANDNSVLDVDFLKSVAPVNADDITVDVDELIDGIATPGRPVDLDITVENADGDLLTDYPVTVTVNKGFLSPNAEADTDLKADPAAAEGGLYGEWKSDGTSKEFTTDDTGETGTVVAIEEDEGFKTDETVTTTVTIEAGGVTKTVPVNFVSMDPLNGGEVRVERAAANQQTVTILPKAPTNESVFYNVFTTDQFGNLVEDENVVLTDNLAGALMEGDDNTTTVDSQLADEAPVLELSSNVAGNQTVEGEWVTDSNTWTDGDLVTAGFQAARDEDVNDTELSDEGETVEWYEIDFANSTYSLAHDTTGDVPVGTTVLMTYQAVDQNGEPIRGAKVGFFRTGPDDYQDGDFNSFGTTNEAGRVSYVFAGAKAGTATVEALITDYSAVGGDQIVPESRATAQVTFVGEPPVDEPVAQLKGKNNGAKPDKLRVKATVVPEGTKVKLFKFVNGKRKAVTTGTTNANGVVKFKVADRNGKKFTKYVAKVAKTDVPTAAFMSNSKRVR